MTVDVEVMIVSFDDLSLKAFDIPKFRGYLGERYAGFHLIHNHMEEDQLRYAYPSVQFKVIGKTPTIMGIGGGIEVLKTVFIDISRLDIDGIEYKINEKSVKLDEVAFGQTDEPFQYQFVLPWMALNQQNYSKYKRLEWNQRRLFLENILRGNLKSFSKGFNYFIPDFDNVHVQADLNPVTRNFKNNRMICFEGTFSTNFVIPDYLGIGKQTARGFGTVVCSDNSQSK